MFIMSASSFCNINGTGCPNPIKSTLHHHFNMWIEKIKILSGDMLEYTS